MEFYIGIDGGGSKTKYVISDQLGNILNTYEDKSSSYKQSSIKETSISLKGMIEKISEGINKEDIIGICFGMPYYGESEKNDLLALETISKDLFPLKVFIVSDALVAWAGSFALLNNGINLVAGTGSLAVSLDKQGQIVRTGGWSEFYSDEGSGYWLGRKTMELFFKQADGRVNRSYLYQRIKNHFSAKSIFSIIDIFDKEYQFKREKIASLQLILEKAALEGDKSAELLYKDSVKELILLVLGLAKKMDYQPKPIMVSYSGGLFKSKKLILDPFIKEISKYDYLNLKKPMLSPEEGAIMLAVKNFAPKKLAIMRNGFLKKKK